MATENLGKTITVASNVSLAAYQYHFAKLTSGKVTYCGDGQDAIGVIQNDPAAADRETVVAIEGQTKVVAGGTCTIDGYGASDSTGRAVNAISGDFVLCRFLEGATVAGTIISAILTSRGNRAQAY